MSTVWEYSAINFYQDPKHLIFYSKQDKLGLSYTLTVPWGWRADLCLFLQGACSKI